MDSVTIKNGVEVHKTNAQAGERTPQDRVVPLRQSIREAQVDRISSNGGEVSHDTQRTMKVTSSQRSGLEGAWGTIRDKNDNVCSNLSEVKGDHSIEIDGIRATVKSWESVGRLARNERGEMILIDAPEESKEKPVPMSQTENLKTEADTANVEVLNQRVGEEATNAFMAKMASAIIDGSDARSDVADYASATNESEERIHQFAEQYLSNLLNSGIDFAVRKSGGKVTGEEISEHLPKLSKGYQKSLLYGLHMNHLASVTELIEVVRQKKII